MTPLLIARHRVTIAGYVNDSITAKPIAGVNISIADAPEIFMQKVRLIGLQFGTAWNAKKDRPDKTTTREDGSFYFLDLPAGDYKIRASVTLPGARYGVVDTSVAIVKDAQSNFMLTWITLSLPCTVLRGTVTSNKTGVNFAEVRVQGSGERTFSDGQGNFCITGLEPGKRTVLVNARGFRPLSQSVSIAAPGDSPAVNFKLLRNNG